MIVRLTTIQPAPDGVWQAAHPTDESAGSFRPDFCRWSAWVNRRFDGRAGGGDQSTPFWIDPSWQVAQLSGAGYADRPGSPMPAWQLLHSGKSRRCFE
jgi:hypothetical protein